MLSRILLVFPATAIALAALALLPACSSTQPSSTVVQAFTVLRDGTGETVGSATFTQVDAGPVTLEVTLQGIAPGQHGIHIHAVGSCVSTETALFGGAGPHLNPLGKSHGLENPNGAHGGDLPNVTVDANGGGSARITTDRVVLATGAASVFDVDGSALVVHAGPDDQLSDPAGNSGSRIACGVIEAR